MAKRMRLPNGFGQISELKGRRLRNKWRAMVTVKWTKEGKPVRKTVGYFKTYNDAYMGLMEYHKAPHELFENITMAELYDQWSEQHFKRIKESAIRIHEAAWKHCEAIYSLPVRDVKVRQIKDVVESEMPPSMHDKVKTLLSLMFDHAMEYEYVDKNYARIASTYVDKNATKHHIPFSDEEIEILWANQDDDCVKIIIVQCYTGFRPNELFTIKHENVDVENWTIVGGLKTKAGKNRLVPVHDRIKPLVLEFYNRGTEHLFGEYNYDWYKYHFMAIRDKHSMNPEHKPHDGRVTFVTNMKRAEANDFAIKHIVGHTIQDLTESVYTKRDPEWLRKELAKLP